MARGGLVKAIALTATGTGLLTLAAAAAGGRRAPNRRTPRGRGDGGQFYSYIAPRRRGRGVPPAPAREPARGDDAAPAGGRVRFLSDLARVLGVEIPRYPVLDVAELAELVRRYRPDASERTLRIYAAWADGESGLNPDVVGDVEWANLNPDKYRRFVLDAAAYKDNPWRGESRA